MLLGGSFSGCGLLFFSPPNHRSCHALSHSGLGPREPCRSVEWREPPIDERCIVDPCPFSQPRTSSYLTQRRRKSGRPRSGTLHRSSQQKTPVTAGPTPFCPPPWPTQFPPPCPRFSAWLELPLLNGASILVLWWGGAKVVIVIFGTLRTRAMRGQPLFWRRTGIEPATYRPSNCCSNR